MAVTLYAHVKGTEGDREFITDCEEQATEMVDYYIQDNARPGGVPPAIRARAVLEVGSDLFHRRQARNGIAGLDGMEGSAVRIARDPMKAAYDLLAPYVKFGIG